MIESLETLITREVKGLHQNVVSRMFLQKGSFPPVVFLARDDQTKPTFHILADYVDEPALLHAMVDVYASDEDVNGTIFVSEAWMNEVRVSSEEGRQIRETGRAQRFPTDDPDREEVLIYFIKSKLINLAARAKILRDSKDDKHPRLGPLKFFPAERAIPIRE